MTGYPTPWTYDEAGAMYDSAGFLVIDHFEATGDDIARKVDAFRLIVRAVNSHDALVEALENMIGEFCNTNFDRAYSYKKAVAALALAKGETK